MQIISFHFNWILRAHPQSTCSSHAIHICLTERKKYPVTKNEYLLMLKWLWILLTHTLFIPKHFNAYRMENGDTHSYAAPMPMQTESTKPNQVLSRQCFIFAQRIFTYESQFHSLQFVRMAKFLLYLSPNAIFRIFQTCSVGGEFTLVVCCYCCCRRCYCWCKVCHVQCTMYIIPIAPNVLCRIYKCTPICML